MATGTGGIGRILPLVGFGVLSCGLASAAHANSEVNCSANFGNSEVPSQCSASAVAVQTVMRVQSQSVVNMISRNVESAVMNSLTAAFRESRGQGQASRDGASGANAGDASPTLGAWGSAAYNYLKIVPDGDVSTHRASNMYTGLAGFDGKISDDVLVGIAISVLNSNTNGFNPNRTYFSTGTTGYSITPYIGWHFADHFVWQATVGGLISHADSSSAVGTRTALASINSHTLLGSTRLSYIDSFGPVETRLFVSGTAQYARTESYRDSLGTYTAGSGYKSHYQGQIGGQVSHDFGGIQPFLEAAYVRDSNIAGVGESSARLSPGLVVDLGRQMTLTVEGDFNFGRETQTETGGLLNLRAAF